MNEIWKKGEKKKIERKLHRFSKNLQIKKIENLKLLEMWILKKLELQFLQDSNNHPTLIRTSVKQLLAFEG
jgi:hypothetical protein